VADVRYTVPGVPPVAANGITAFSPAFVRHAASSAQQYKELVRGYPGTRAIPMEARSLTQISPDYGDLAQAGYARSSDAPDAIWPQQYFQAGINETPGGVAPRPAVYSPTQPGRTTLLPIPAEDGRGVYQASSARLSRRALLQRIAEVRWPPRVYKPPAGTWNG